MKFLLLKSMALSAIIMLLGACHDDNDSTEPPMVETFNYQVRLVNLTQAQPISPPVAILHSASFHAWTLGAAASNELEALAEDGDGSSLVASQSNNSTFSSSAAVGPGSSQTFDISTTDAMKTYLTVAGMLVNTNDAFSGINGIALDDMSVGDVRAFYTQAYDAGTEFNDEVAANFPGPAGGGEGFNVDRDDVTQVVTHHGGIVSQDVDYAESALTEAHRFDNPVMLLEITRL